MKMTACKLLSVVSMFVLSVLLYFLYTPLPEDMDDPWRVRALMAVIKLVYFPAQIREYMGQGNFLDNLRHEQMPIMREGDASPPSSSIGRLNVTRATIEGLHVIVYKPWDAKNALLRPGMIYFHGGGWIMASADFYDWTVYEYALCTDSVTISVDHRLAPQHPFPAAFEDAVTVIRHILRYGGRFGIDVKRVGLIADSSGANIGAAAVLHLARTQSDHPPLKYQVLICPFLQALNFRLPSYHDNTEIFNNFNTKRAAAFAALYLGFDDQKGDFYGDIFSRNGHVNTEFRTNSKYAQYINETNLPEKYRLRRRVAPVKHEPHDEAVFQQIKTHLVDPRFSPLMADDLSGIPKTHIVVQHFDVLRDDGLLYAKRLRDFGVETNVYEGKGFHIDHMKILPEFLHSRSGQKSMKSTCQFVKRVLKQTACSKN